MTIVELSLIVVIIQKDHSLNAAPFLQPSGFLLRHPTAALANYSQGDFDNPPLLSSSLLHPPHPQWLSVGLIILWWQAFYRLLLVAALIAASSAIPLNDEILPEDNQFISVDNSAGHQTTTASQSAQ